MAVSEPAGETPNRHAFDLPLLPNGGIDLYALIEVPQLASQTVLRARIGELYSASLANTEHRDVRKRRYYETLHELLPRCYEILLNEEKRQSYDEYLAGARSGASVPEFDEFLNQITKEFAARAKEREGLLEVRGLDFPAPGPIEPADQAAPANQIGPVAAAGAGVLAGLAALILLRGVMRMPLGMAIAVGVLAACAGVGITFVLLSRKSSS